MEPTSSLTGADYPTSTDTISVWVIEDNLRYRMRMLDLFENDPTIRCTFATEYCTDALERIESGEKPDVILMDLTMSTGMGGIECTYKIREIDTIIHIIALTVHDEEKHVTSMFMAGASGYLLKSSSPSEIVDAIHDVVKGGQRPLTPTIANMILNFFFHQKETRSLRKKEHNLSDREMEVLTWLTREKTKREIAKILVTSPHTIDTHIRRIYKKLQVHSRTGAITKAIKQGLVAPD